MLVPALTFTVLYTIGANMTNDILGLTPKPPYQCERVAVMSQLEEGKVLYYTCAKNK